MRPFYGDLVYQFYNPFVPPNIALESSLLNKYCDEIQHFLKTKYPILTSGAWHLSFYDGIDLYGLDLLIELVRNLKLKHPNVGLIFGLADSDYNKDYYMKCVKIIKENGIQNNIIFLQGQQELWPLIKRSQIFIRSTITDGDPLSIQEALFFNVPVVASDCTNRDNRVKLFRSRNIDSLTETIMAVLNESSAVKS
jgi:glycosyltransferase involved in cell wall biosynthesis